jgi:phosphoglycerol geranylgeranyltransferase
MRIYSTLCKEIRSGKKKFAVLIDPDKTDSTSLQKLVKIAVRGRVDYFFVGGSLLINDNQDSLIACLRENSDIPVLLFPGNSLQLSDKADGLLLLSLISGRNPEMLIGRHVISAPFLKKSKLEIIPTGYMLVESGSLTTVAYMSNTTPIPSGKSDVAMCTAIAGELLGLKLIYLDAGSGALHPVPGDMITKVRNNITLPLIVGGGINTAAKARNALNAGADVVVIGNAIEKDPLLIYKIAEII